MAFPPSLSRRQTLVQVDWEIVALLLKKPWPVYIVAYDLKWQASTGTLMTNRECADRWGWSKTRAHEYIKNWRTMA